MKRRPILVVIISVLLIATGIGGLIQHHAAIRVGNFGGLMIAVVEVLALTAGVFMLLGHDWARWLAMAWIAFHVIISFWNGWPKVLIHVVIFAIFAFALFRRDARDYFRPPRSA